ncbi:hypothethical protein (plasmid) [Ralstonia solanacearum PSI07]|nr:hypothethical protein [Ralstonia solanacearum PSI07]
MKRLSIWALLARPLLKSRRGHGYEVFSAKTELFCRAGDCDDLPIAC